MHYLTVVQLVLLVLLLSLKVFAFIQIKELVQVLLVLLHSDYELVQGVHVAALLFHRMHLLSDSNLPSYTTPPCPKRQQTQKTKQTKVTTWRQTHSGQADTVINE